MGLLQFTPPISRRPRIYNLAFTTASQLPREGLAFTTAPSPTGTPCDEKHISQIAMPILSGSQYPADVVQRQQAVLALRGYHLIYEVPNEEKGWERDLPCPVTDGLCVDVFLYQNSASGQCVRFCLNKYTRDPYVEIGDFIENGSHHVSTTVNQYRGSKKLTNILPKQGQYYWIRFAFASPNKFQGYFQQTKFEERRVDYSKLKYFYVHELTHNKTSILSLHITKENIPGAPSPLQGNIPKTSLNGLYAGMVLNVYGTFTGGSDKKIKFSTYEEGNSGNSTDAEFNVGSTNPDSIMFRILAYGVQAFAGDGGITASTNVMAGTRQAFLEIKKNFNVETVKIRGWIKYQL